MLISVDMCQQIIYLILIFFIFAPAVRAQDDDSGARLNQLYTQAEDAYEHGQLEKAIGLYKETIKLAPDIFEPKFQCANACLATNRPELLPDAIALLRDVIKLKPDFARAHAALGTALARADEPEEAEAVLRRALALDNKLLAVRTLLAELLFERAAYKEAETELKLIAAEGKPDAHIYLLIAAAQQRDGRNNDAIASFTQVLELQRNDADTLYRRGRLYLLAKNYASALADFKAAYQLNPQDSDTGLALVECYIESGDKVAAIELARKLEAQAKPENRGQLAELLARTGANNDAIAQLQKLIEREPKNVEYLVRLGELCLNIDPVRSAEYWQQAMVLAPTPEHEAGLAAALLKAQRFEDAIHHFNAVLENNASSYEAHAGLALALFKLERFAPAAEQFIWVTRARPDNAVSIYFLAICFDRLGDFERALAGYQLFLKTASAKSNQLEIEKVQLRLPSLRRQLEKHGKKKKKN